MTPVLAILDAGYALMGLIFTPALVIALTGAIKCGAGKSVVPEGHRKLRW